MAYSKITKTCVWYTYWKISNSPYKNDQLFCINDYAEFAFRELQENIQQCILVMKNTNEFSKYTDLEFDELKKYMNEFLKDVEKDSNFQWVYSDNKIPGWCKMSLEEHHQSARHCHAIKNKNIEKEGREFCVELKCKYLRPMNKYDFINQKESNGE